MSQVIGRVVTGVHETLRGPDVIHRVAIRREWLLAGETIELVLPRNLSCATCEGGGCDRCGRSGAITLRSRGEAPVSVQVTLPRRSSQELREQPAFVVRVPDHGGAAAREDMPRGLLLLKITTSSGTDAGIVLSRPSAPPTGSDAAAGTTADAPLSSVRPTRRRAAVLVALVVLVALGLLLAAGLRRAGFFP